MIEVSELIGAGFFACFFRIHGAFEGYGVKVLFAGSKVTHYQTFQNELARAKFLEKKGIPIPHYMGIERVRIPKNIDEIIRHGWGKIPKDYREDVQRYMKSGRYWGLIIEHIDHDVTVTNIQRLTHLFRREYVKLRRAGFKLGWDVRPGSIFSPNNNVLYSPSKDKIYFIDTDQWKFPLFWKLRLP